MKNSIGSSVILTVFGESHGPATGVVLDGMAPGVEVDWGKLQPGCPAAVPEV